MHFIPRSLWILKAMLMAFALLTATAFSEGAMAMTVLFPLPRQGFDPTESAVPWKILTDAGHRVVFSTPDALPGEADPIMVTGEGLGLLKPLLASNDDSVRAHSEMIASPEFQFPVAWDELHADDFDALVLVGGHAKGMREYLESSQLQNLVSEFFATDKPIGAICHGVLLAARSKRADGKSVLYEKETTTLLETQELLAWKMTKIWMGDYYRTYSVTLESEVRSFLKSDSQFQSGPLPIARDTPESDWAGFVVRDGSYLSARWPGDAHRFGRSFLKMLSERE